MNGFLIRWALAFILLGASYNPTQWNYLIWVKDNYRLEPALAVLFGLLLLAGYIVYLRATLKSIGLIGIGLVTAILASAVWVLVDQGLLTFGRAGAKTWIGLLGLSFLLGIGMSWSHVRRVISGQLDVEDDDE